MNPADICTTLRLPTRVNANRPAFSLHEWREVIWLIHLWSKLCIKRSVWLLHRHGGSITSPEQPRQQDSDSLVDEEKLKWASTSLYRLYYKEIINSVIKESFSDKLYHLPSEESLLCMCQINIQPFLIKDIVVLHQINETFQHFLHSH